MVSVYEIISPVPFLNTVFIFFEHSLVMRNGLRSNVLLNLDCNDLFIGNSLKAFSVFKKTKQQQQNYMKKIH